MSSTPRDMSRTYRHMNLDDLLELHSKKLQHIMRLESEVMTYFRKNELNRVRFNLKQIEVEIACKELQLPLL